MYSGLPFVGMFTSITTDKLHVDLVIYRLEWLESFGGMSGSSERPRETLSY